MVFVPNIRTLAYGLNNKNSTLFLQLLSIDFE